MEANTLATAAERGREGEATTSTNVNMTDHNLTFAFCGAVDVAQVLELL